MLFHPTRHHSHQSDLARSVDWRKIFASDKEVMDRATGTLLGTGGGAVPSTLGQVTTSAEIEEVRGLSCGALDLEFAAEEEAATQLSATCQGLHSQDRQTNGTRSSAPPVRVARVAHVRQVRARVSRRSFVDTQTGTSETVHMKLDDSGACRNHLS